MLATLDLLRGLSLGQRTIAEAVYGSLSGDSLPSTDMLTWLLAILNYVS